MNVGELQRKLSLWAEEDKEHRFFDLYHLLYDMDWLRLAHDHVAQNAGSCTAGCDGINMRLFDEGLEENLQQLAAELKSEAFEPHPVRRVYIRKTNGKRRPLGIPSIKDRIVQEALRMILEPIYEADFSQNSFGFRPNRCTMDAAKYIWICTNGMTKYHWIVEGDLASYFDTICHRRLVKVLRRRVKDEKVIRLVWKYLRAGVMEGKLFRDTEAGVPQGGILSPLLSNVYLHGLDRYMEKYTGLSNYERSKRRQRGEANFLYVRYADDFVVLCNGTRAQAEAMKEELFSFLGTLRLRLSKEKTAITHVNDGFRFLGFWIRRSLTAKGRKATKVLIPEEAKRKMLERIKHCTKPSTHQESVDAKILSLNRIIGGWCRYYQYTGKASSDFHKMRNKVYWYMAHWLGRKYQLSIPKVLMKYGKENTFATPYRRLVMPDEYSTKIYRKSARKPNPYTTREVLLERETLPSSTYWAGYEERPGMADLKPLVRERDGDRCQICEKPVTADTSEVDHIRAVRRFKRPVDANELENLWTLCKDCHQWKTESDRRMESPLQGKLARRVRRGERRNALSWDFKARSAPT